MLITNVIITESHKSRTNNKNKEYIFFFNLARLQHCIINSDKAAHKGASPLLSEGVSFLAHHCEKHHVTKQKKLSPYPGHRKAILISLFRKKKIKEAFFGGEKKNKQTKLF